MVFVNSEKSLISGDPLDRDNAPAAITDAGCERDLNEDRYAVIESQSGLAWVVCDGMGGVSGGELAAQLVIDSLKRDLEGLPGRPPAIALKSSILEANRMIVLRRQNQAFSQMGTTIVSALFKGIEVAIANVGDSRAYLVRGGIIEQLTTNHTLVQELVDSGEITNEEAMDHPQAHVLTKAIGSEPGLEIDLRKYWAWQVPEEEEQDILVLCTDGLYSLVSDEEISKAVSSMAPKKACVDLVNLAKVRGGFDNITLAVIPIVGQLRDEPPMGYDDKRTASVDIGKFKSLDSQSFSQSILKNIFVITLLSLLSVILVVLVMIFSLAN